MLRLCRNVGQQWRTFASETLLGFGPLTAVSPIDGRYSKACQDVASIFSEYGLIEQRTTVEIRWLQYMAACEQMPGVPALSESANAFLDNIVDGFSIEDAQRVKEIEKTTNHDVKAVEYMLKEKVAKNDELANVSEYLHFACTSEDINNLSYGRMLLKAKNEIILKQMDSLIDHLINLAERHAATPMMARTHGQPASPTTIGKEVANFAYRLAIHRQRIQQAPIRGKFNGAVGNYNAHICAFPDIDWSSLSEDFIENSLGLVHNPYTTQIEPHDFVAELFDGVTRFNNVLLDFNRDMWGYISLGYFKQRAVEGEIGSSTMPHKVNPIDFENSEGNVGLANSTMTHLSNKLLVSRYQRDLSDSTVLRAIGVGFAHSMIAYRSTLKGLGKIEVQESKLEEELDQNWEVLAEPVQTVMRRYGLPSPYEQLKTLTRGRKVDATKMKEFVESLQDLPAHEMKRLLELTPGTYIGNAAQAATAVRKRIEDLS